MKVAVIDVPHLEGEKSCELMLRSAGYQVFGISRELKSALSYMPVRSDSRLSHKADMKTFLNCDLFAVIKHFSVEPTLAKFPRLRNKILWFAINGGRPGIPISHAPYKMCPLAVPVPYVGAIKWYEDGSSIPTSGPRYFAYLPLRDKNLYPLRKIPAQFSDPISLIHNVYGWGAYGWVTDAVRRLGVKHHGNRCPENALNTTQVKNRLSTALCYVHLKGCDCPGYSLYEAMLSGCPVILPTQFLDLTDFRNLYEDGETCIILDDSITLKKTQERLQSLCDQLSAVFNRLRDPKENQRIGKNGRERLLRLMWDADRDGLEFTRFMQQSFGGVT